MSTVDLPQRKDKIRKTWQSPFLVTDINKGNNVYEIKSLLD